jgi:hypothetical protein
MTSSAAPARAERVWFDKNNLWVALADGRQLSVPLAYFPRLLHATASQRRNCVISGGGTGLHWEQVDEDISVPALLAGVRQREEQGNVWSGSPSRAPKRKAR